VNEDHTPTFRIAGAEHGGFAHDDTNVMMLTSNPKFEPRAFFTPVTTRQAAPTILKLLRLDPDALDAVRFEGTEVLPGVDTDERRQD
jgi:hypothetical protein